MVTQNTGRVCLFSLKDGMIICVVVSPSILVLPPSIIVDTYYTLRIMPRAFDRGIDDALLEDDTYEPLLRVSKRKHNDKLLLVLAWFLLETNCLY